MEKLKNFFVLIGEYLFVSLCAFAIFGLSLALAWVLPFSENTHNKLTSAIASAGLALFAGGYLIGKLRQHHRTNFHTSVWGLLTGFVAFGYISGSDWKWIAALSISGIISTCGGC